MAGQIKAETIFTTTKISSNKSVINIDTATETLLILFDEETIVLKFDEINCLFIGDKNGLFIFPGNQIMTQNNKFNKKFTDICASNNKFKNLWNNYFNNTRPIKGGFLCTCVIKTDMNMEYFCIFQKQEYKCLLSNFKGNFINIKNIESSRWWSMLCRGYLFAMEGMVVIDDDFTRLQALFNDNNDLNLSLTKFINPHMIISLAEMEILGELEEQSEEHKQLSPELEGACLFVENLGRFRDDIVTVYENIPLSKKDIDHLKKNIITNVTFAVAVMWIKNNISTTFKILSMFTTENFLKNIKIYNELIYVFYEGCVIYSNNSGTIFCESSIELSIEQFRPLQVSCPLEYLLVVETKITNNQISNLTNYGQVWFDRLIKIVCVTREYALSCKNMLK